MKPSDDPRCPFNWRHPDYVPVIDWSDMVSAAKYSASSSKTVNDMRATGRDNATVYGMSKKPLTSIKNPRHFHIYSKAVPNGKNKRTK